VLVFEDPPDLAGGIAAHLDRVLARISMPSVARRSVAVLGFGPAGRAAAEQLRRALAEVTVYELDAARRAEAQAMGFEVTADKAAALGDRYAILCASGGCAIEAADVGALAHETVLANVASRGAEIALGPSTPARPIELVPLLSEAPGDRRFMTRAWRYRDKDLVVVRSGFPIEGPERE
jgi:threonine dehydrogenase-like Zn-dependent dehydrogenase